MAEICVKFAHPTDGRTMTVDLDDSMTGQEVVDALIANDFVQNDPQGYTLAVKGGSEIGLQQTIADAGLKPDDTVRVIPATDAGVART